MLHQTKAEIDISIVVPVFKEESNRIKKILKEYNEALNNNTAKHIVVALCTYEKLIERTKISIDKNIFTLL